jgi:signal peptidase I
MNPERISPCFPELFRDILERGLSLRIKATGKSMSPFLRGGEIITIKKVPFSSLRRGDLILFVSGAGQILLHRIIGKKRLDDGSFVFRTKGDASMTFDEPAAEERILGKACSIEKAVDAGEFKCIDMEIYRQRGVNYLIAVTGIFKYAVYFYVMRRLRRALG